MAQRLCGIAEAGARHERLIYGLSGLGQHCQQISILALAVSISADRFLERAQAIRQHTIQAGGKLHVDLSQRNLGVGVHCAEQAVVEAGAQRQSVRLLGELRQAAVEADAVHEAAQVLLQHPLDVGHVVVALLRQLNDVNRCG